MTYCQVRGRAASLSPKNRPKIPLPAKQQLKHYKQQLEGKQQLHKQQLKQQLKLNSSISATKQQRKQQLEGKR